MKKLYIVVSLLMVFSFLISGFSRAQAAESDKLAEILARGYMIVSTDPAYPPQSELVETAQRLQTTNCPSDTQTANQMTGFDIDVAIAIADKLGVEACFLTVAWDMITAGSWANRWDISVGSMTITPERMTKLYFTQPYYTTPAAFFVYNTNTTFTQPSDLSGTVPPPQTFLQKAWNFILNIFNRGTDLNPKVGACSGCTYDAYVAGTLAIPGETINFVVKDATFVGYETDLYALQDLALGDGVRLDAVLTAQPTGAAEIDKGQPFKQLGDPVYFEYLAGAVDKESTPDPVPFLKKVSEVILGLNTDGTLLQLSNKYYGLDLTTAATSFDLAALNQWP